MRCRTSLNANQARRQRSKEPQYVGSPYPLANDNRALVVDTVNLKDIPCDIEADPDRGHGDLSFEQQCCPADPIRTWLGSSGGRPPHLDSNHRYRSAIATEFQGTGFARLFAGGRRIQPSGSWSRDRQTVMGGPDGRLDNVGGTVEEPMARIPLAPAQSQGTCTGYDASGEQPSGANSAASPTRMCCSPSSIHTVVNRQCPEDWTPIHWHSMT